MILSTPAGSKVLSPVTSLVETLSRDRSVNTAQAIEEVQMKLGLPADVDLLSFDPLHAYNRSQSQAIDLQKINAQIANITNAVEDTERAIISLGTVMDASGSANVDLFDESVLNSVAESASLDEEKTQGLKEASAEIANAANITDISLSQWIAGNRKPGETIQGTEGDDQLSGTHGDDVIDAGSGTDTLLVEGSRSDYLLRAAGDDYRLLDMVDGSDGNDRLYNIEAIEFADAHVDLTMQEMFNAIDTESFGKLQKLYIGFFDRIPEAAGIKYWVQQLNDGVSFDQIANRFYDAGVEFGVYSESMSDRDFIRELYANLLARDGDRNPPSEEDITWWENWLNQSDRTKGQMALGFLEGAEQYKDDPEYGWVNKLLNDKALLANYVTVEQGLSYLTPQENIAKGRALAEAVNNSSLEDALELVGVSDFGFL